jgi:hypothetical protein
MKKLAKLSAAERAAHINGRYGLLDKLLTGCFALLVVMLGGIDRTTTTQPASNSVGSVTTGNNSPVVINVNTTTINQQTNTATFTNVITLGKTVQGCEAKILGKRVFEATQDISESIPTNGLASISTPRNVYQLNDQLTEAYKTGEIATAVDVASKITNAYVQVTSAYHKEWIAVEQPLLEITSDAYFVLAEYSMFKKDFSKARELMDTATVVFDKKVMFRTAMYVAALLSEDKDDEASMLIARVINKYSEQERYEFINTLTKMGYLLPYKLSLNSRREWQIQEIADFEKNFRLTKKLEFPPMTQMRSEQGQSSWTFPRWVGLNKYEVVKLSDLFESARKKIAWEEMKAMNATEKVKK